MEWKQEGSRPPPPWSVGSFIAHEAQAAQQQHTTGRRLFNFGGSFPRYSAAMKKMKIQRQVPAWFARRGRVDPRMGTLGDGVAEFVCPVGVFLTEINERYM